jgi:hypothetical protein
MGDISELYPGYLRNIPISPMEIDQGYYVFAWE